MNGRPPLVLRLFLLLIGTALIALGVILWLSTPPGNTSTVGVTTTRPCNVCEAATKGKKPKGGASRGIGVIVRTTKTTTTTNGDPQSTDLEPAGTPSQRSETLVVGLLAGGVVLLLCGAFLDRISKIPTPWGDIELLAPEDQAKIAETVFTTVLDKGYGKDPEKLRAALELAFRLGLIDRQIKVARTPTRRAMRRRTLHVLIEPEREQELGLMRELPDDEDSRVQSIAQAAVTMVYGKPEPKEE